MLPSEILVSGSFLRLLGTAFLLALQPEQRSEWHVVFHFITPQSALGTGDQGKTLAMTQLPYGLC